MPATHALRALSCAAFLCCLLTLVVAVLAGCSAAQDGAAMRSGGTHAHEVEGEVVGFNAATSVLEIEIAADAESAGENTQENSLVAHFNVPESIAQNPRRQDCLTPGNKVRVTLLVADSSEPDYAEVLRAYDVLPIEQP